MSRHKLIVEDRRRGTMLFVALLAVGLVIAYEWAVHPHLGALQAAQRFERSLEDYTKTNRTVNIALREQQRRLEQLSQERDELWTRVFDSDGAQDFLGRLESFCASNTCMLMSVTSLDYPLQHVSTVVPMMTSVSVAGAYDGIIGFIETLKARPQAVVIESLRMAELQSGSTQVRCSIVFTIYIHNTEDLRP